MKRSKIGLRIVSMALTLSLVLTAVPLESVSAKEIEHEQLTDSSELWTPELEPPLPNTEGDLPLEELETAVLSDADKPEVISDELIAERDHVNRLWAQEDDLNTIIFQNRDGTKTMYWFDQPVKYVDENGEIKDKKNELTEQGNDYTNAENDINSYFPKKIHKNKGVVLRYNDIEIEIAPLINGSSGASRQTGHNKDGKATDIVEYPNVFDKSISVRYTPTFEGFKEDIILKENIGINEFSFKIKTDGLSLIQNEGVYYLADPLTGEKIIQVGDIVVYDSKSAVDANSVADTEPEAVDEPTKEEPPELTEEEAKALYFPEESPEPVYTHRYQVETVKENSEYIVTIVVDKAYLDNEDTVYPVTVDPSLTLQTSFSQDATIYSNYRVNEGYTPNMFVGNYSARYGGTCGVARSLVKFPGLFSNSTFKSLSTDRISKVLYIPRDTMCEGDAVWIDCYRMTQNWSEDTVKCNSSIWNAYGGSLLDDNCVYYNHGTGSNGTGTGHWYPFDITQAVKDWKNGRYGGVSNHYGIMLKAHNESNAAKTFATNNHSSLSPNLIVEYDPSVTGISLKAACKEVNVGWSGYVPATVYPSSAKNKTVYWTSSKPDVASVDKNSGLICSKQAGSTVITATTADGGFKARCTLMVEEAPWIPLSPSLVSNIGGPPRTFPDGTPITAENKQDYYNGERYTAVYFLDYIWPIQTAVWDKPGIATHLRTPWYTVYTVWAQETYGLNWLEQFWHNADAFVFGVSDAVVSILEGTWTLISNPGEVIDGMELVLNAVLKNGTERELLNQLITDTIDQCWDDFTGSSETRSRLIGRVVGEVLIDYIATKGATKAISELKNTKIFSKIQTLIAKGRIDVDDAAQVLSRYSKFSSQMKGKIDDLLDIAKKVRKQVEPLYNDPKKPGNVGVALTQIKGVPKELRAYSKISLITDKGSDLGYVLQKTNPQFTVLESWRLTDTESKILEEIASILGNNTSATGAIQLFTERTPCASCRSVISQFRKRYPNIELTVIDANMCSY